MVLVEYPEHREHLSPVCQLPLLEFGLDLAILKVSLCRSLDFECRRPVGLDHLEQEYGDHQKFGRLSQGAVLASRVDGVVVVLLA